MGLYSDIDMIGSMCNLMARGAIISMLSVILILPAMFLLFDKVIGKTTLGMRPNNLKEVSDMKISCLSKSLPSCWPAGY